MRLRQLLVKNNIHIIDKLLTNLDEVFHFLDRVKIENNEDLEIMANLIKFIGLVNEEVKKVKYCSRDTISYFGNLFDFFVEIKGIIRNNSEAKNLPLIIKKYFILFTILLIFLTFIIIF